MIAALLVLTGVGFLVAAGFRVERRRFNPAWLGLACLGLVAFTPDLQALTGV